jgi:hypothetical protein
MRTVVIVHVNRDTWSVAIGGFGHFVFSSRASVIAHLERSQAVTWSDRQPSLS